MSIEPKVNGREAMARVKPVDLVVDIGGASNIIPRANYVIDIRSYNDRRKISPEIEQFTRDQWIQMDIGGSRKYELPFEFKEVDFIIASHVLEDIADPFNLIREMQRVSKAGWIECPSREWEQTKGVDSDSFCGFEHHRWYVQLVPWDNNYAVQFTRKSPWAITQPFKPEDGHPFSRMIGFYWTDSFHFYEKLHLTKEASKEAIMKFRSDEWKQEIGVYS